MSHRSKTVVLCSASLAVVACVASAIFIARASSESLSPVVQNSPPPKINKGRRSLSLQPEALRVSRRLGKRFDSSSHGTSVLTGNFTIGESQRPLVVTRQQTDSGEMVELRLANSVMAWSAEEGMTTTASAVTETERLLFERLIFDSPDNFVLAQLRGASYFTVARSVRPPAVPDDYSGPLWTIVRVDERQGDKSLQPKSSWRLYYIDSNTGLIDRIVSSSGEQTIEARIVSWTEQSGEKVPAQIIWTIDSREVMSYQATSISHNK